MKYKAKVLIACSETLVGQNIADTLRSEGYDVDTASTSQEALVKEAVDDFAVFLMDDLLVSLDGLDIQGIIRSRNPEISIITITGESQQLTAAQRIKPGVFEYLSKPVSTAELCFVVNKVLEARYLYERVAFKTRKKGKKLVRVDLPEDVYCIPEHAWVKRAKNGAARIGIHHVFMKMLGRITAIDFPREGRHQEQGELCLTITGCDGEFHRFWAPISGTVTEINRNLGKDFSVLADDPYGEGWLLEMEPANWEGEFELLRPLEAEVDPVYHIPRPGHDRERLFLYLRGFYPQKFSG